MDKIYLNEYYKEYFCFSKTRGQKTCFSHELFVINFPEQRSVRRHARLFLLLQSYTDLSDTSSALRPLLGQAGVTG